MTKLAVDRGLLSQLSAMVHKATLMMPATDRERAAMVDAYRAADALLSAPGVEEPTCNHCGAALDPARAYADPKTR